MDGYVYVFSCSGFIELLPYTNASLSPGNKDEQTWPLGFPHTHAQWVVPYLSLTSNT